MADNGGDSRSGNVGSASVVAAAAAVGSVESRFSSRIERWNGSEGRGCWGGLFCFGSDKRTKRIVPSSRVPNGTAALVPGNGSRPLRHSNQNAALPQPLIAPPSSPASFTNSSLPSTAQSPNCFCSISDYSLGEPSSTMFVTGPYAHETQLVSPPVFSALTTEPSTAPFTPPELAHQTTPSSPDVPYARYLSSSMAFKSVDKVTGMVSGNDLHMTYALYPESPSSSLISPASGTPRTGVSSPFPDSETPSQRDGLASSQDVPCTRNGSSKLFSGGSSNSKNSMLSLDSSFFYPSSERFHLDKVQQPHQSHASRGRLSITEGNNYTNGGDRHNKTYKQDVEEITREGDSYTNGGNRHNKVYKQDVEEITKQEDNHANGGNRHNKAYKQDVEELESYRASFGFSADELVTTPSYVEISDEVDISFSVPSIPGNDKQSSDQFPINNIIGKVGKERMPLGSPELKKSNLTFQVNANKFNAAMLDISEASPGHLHPFISGDGSLSDGACNGSPNDTLFLKMWNARGSKSFRASLPNYDAEVDCRRSRSLKGSMMTV